jgi:hypothetical protein
MARVKPAGEASEVTKVSKLQRFDRIKKLFGVRTLGDLFPANSTPNNAENDPLICSGDVLRDLCQIGEALKEKKFSLQQRRTRVKRTFTPGIMVRHMEIRELLARCKRNEFEEAVMAGKVRLTKYTDGGSKEEESENGVGAYEYEYDGTEEPAEAGAPIGDTIEVRPRRKRVERPNYKLIAGPVLEEDEDDDEDEYEPKQIVSTDQIRRHFGIVAGHKLRKRPINSITKPTDDMDITDATHDEETPEPVPLAKRAKYMKGLETPRTAQQTSSLKPGAQKLIEGPTTNMSPVSHDRALTQFSATLRATRTMLRSMEERLKEEDNVEVAANLARVAGDMIDQSLARYPELGGQ